MSRHVRLLVPAVLAMVIAPAVAAQSAADLADRMLAAIGGRTAWATVRNTVNDSQQNRLEEPTAVRSVITMDFTAPRFRIETTAPGLRLVRVVDGDRHWRLNRQGAIEPIPAATLEEDRRWYAAHVYRTIHRLAAGDPALTTRVGPTGRLEIVESGARLAWFALDARGEPYAFGAWNDEVGSITGPWDVERSGIRHPRWVARPDGSWRATIQALDVNINLTPGLFSRPAPR